MVPTALSQILEQVVNAVVSLVAAWQLMQLHAAENTAAYGAAGGTTGTLAGAAVGLLLVVFLFTRERRPRRAYLEQPEDHAQIYKALVLTVIPVILSQTVYQIGNTLDDLIFGNLMALKGVAEEEVTALLGVFNTQYNQLVNLPVAVATAMAASTVPGIVSALTAGDRRQAHRKISAVVKLNMAVAIPAAVGLAVLAGPMMRLLFPALAEDHGLAARLLETGAWATIFYALSTITTSILPGLGPHAAAGGPLRRLPGDSCGAGVRPALVYGPGGLFPHHRQRHLPGPGVGAQLPGGAAEAALPVAPGPDLCGSGAVRCLHGRGHLGQPDALLEGIHCPGILALVVSVALSVVVYGVLLLKLHCFSDKQLSDLPMGGKLLALSRRLDRR